MLEIRLLRAPEAAVTARERCSYGLGRDVPHRSEFRAVRL
jgi:hypothetical protein